MRLRKWDCIVFKNINTPLTEINLLNTYCIPEDFQAFKLLTLLVQSAILDKSLTSFGFMVCSWTREMQVL